MQLYLLGSAAAVRAHERCGLGSKKSVLPGGLEKPRPQVFVEEADWFDQNSLSVLTTAAVALMLVAAAAGDAAEGASGVCWGSEAVGSESGVPWAESDGAEVSSCMPGTGSLCGQVGREGKSWAGRTEEGWGEAPRS